MHYHTSETPTPAATRPRAAVWDGAFRLATAGLKPEARHVPARLRIGIVDALWEPVREDLLGGTHRRPYFPRRCSERWWSQHAP
jgi:hypothetical protein